MSRRQQVVRVSANKGEWRRQHGASLDLSATRHFLTDLDPTPAERPAPLPRYPPTPRSQSSSAPVAWSGRMRPWCGRRVRPCKGASSELWEGGKGEEARGDAG